LKTHSQTGKRIVLFVAVVATKQSENTKEAT
jgi:hypothetical protein